MILRCDVRIDRIERDGADTHIVLADGERLPFDVVVAGVGAQPNTVLAEAAGLDIENGIRVDEYLRTSDPLVFAAGDCCSYPHAVFGGRRIRSESWRGAQDQARVVAHNVLYPEQPQAFRVVPWLWSDHFELSVHVAGLGDAAVTDVARERADGGALRFGLDADGRLVSAAGVGPGTSVAKDVRLGEMLIAAGAVLDASLLADPSVSLKVLVRTAESGVTAQTTTSIT